MEKSKLINSAKTLFLLIAIHVFFLIIGSILFILLFHTRLFINIDVLFYRGIALLFTSCLVLTAILLLLRHRKYIRIFTYKDIVLTIIIFFSLNIVFFTLLPVTADRSISVFILGYMNKNSNESFTDEKMTQVFIKKYLNGSEGIDKRFHEQIVSGNIMKTGKNYKITKQGQFIIKLYLIIGEMFAVTKKNLSP
ncbi:MAG: hypothetical protein COX79_03990 [Candidatus Levybacteria bacterium CG_4_10_14_0_2_um_filter_36_16]|nr:MAG: hypothetical protein AUK12_04500 [Candidatus Levybacteria bacterium CG2_30_37_29]PIZ96980.1 MAG: hypothetical protein COX79_03990 [Candidatus Levybacteria bacterium CG_4_10_14_0_2_um_filter_36_16]